MLDINMAKIQTKERSSKGYDYCTVVTALEFMNRTQDPWRAVSEKENCRLLPERLLGAFRYNRHLLVFFLYDLSLPFHSADSSLLESHFFVGFSNSLFFISPQTLSFKRFLFRTITNQVIFKFVAHFYFYIYKH